MALLEHKSSGEGQLIDLALYESLAKSLDGMYIGAIEGHDVPQRSGTSNPSIAPHDIYPMGDGEFVSLPVSTQNMYARLCEIVSRPDLVTDERFATNQARVTNREALDVILRPLFLELGAEEFLCRANAAGVAATRINDPLEYFKDPHVTERGSFESIWDAALNREITMQSVVPRYSRTPGRLTKPGPELGDDTDEILRTLLNMTDSERQQLRRDRVI
jgi:crotonobetainyl-CoA:carnitine CoA-transferase CaiB-like acyl-CoA transferase